MLLSRLFGQTRRERSAQGDSASHDLLLRAGWIRQHAAGIYSYLTPGLRALRRIEAIVREEMDRLGAQEILMPVVQSADAWKATGRYDSIDDTLLRLRDRRGHDMVLGMTHEEIVAQLAAGVVRSYRDADVVVYQIQTKFRDEARPRGGLLRTREFVMKDAYSLHVEEAGLVEAYDAQAEAYGRIFRGAGLPDVRMVRSSSGDMGGSVAHEFVTLLDAGEDTVAVCAGCGDAANADLLENGRCAACGGTPEPRRALEVGNIFQLGRRYGEALGAMVVDRQGRSRPLLMGSYGIGVSRLLAALIEHHHDERGIVLPAAVAPFDAHIVVLDAVAEGAARDAYAALHAAGLAVLLDDRDAQAGEKLADADLMGAPIRITFGRRTTREGVVELRERRSGTVHETATADVADAAAEVSRVRRNECL